MHSIKRVFTTWNSLPGNWDALHLGELFSSDNEWGIPTIAQCLSLPAQLVQWGSRPALQAVKPESNTAVHFFVDDYRFESLWRHPERNLDTILHVGCALSPDFSLFRDMPLVMQMWNVYRNRWLGCYWQAQGIEVIPTISWSKPHDFCYAGVEQGSVVAVSFVGIEHDQKARYLFREGFEKMIAVLHPRKILCYGKMPRDMQVENVVVFPTRWDGQKKKFDPLSDCASLWDWKEA